MTECERIIKDGVLPEDFFVEEEICGFFVDGKRKKLWAVLVDLLVRFDDVCRRHNLKYWLSFGGLLGIVRHKGFIPWDDDLDVCMPREDYDALMKLADEFSAPYYLQIPIVDDGYFCSYARLRNSNTAAISAATAFQNFNQGCFLDIFPLDNCREDDMETNAETIKDLLIWNSTNMKRSNPYLSGAYKDRLTRYPYRNPKELFDQAERISKKHNHENTEYCGTSVITFCSPFKLSWMKTDIYPLSESDFYGHKIFIPHNPHNVLRRTYNNYMEFPPVEKRGIVHADFLFDADSSYLSIKQSDKFDNWIRKVFKD